MSPSFPQQQDFFPQYDALRWGKNRIFTPKKATANTDTARGTALRAAIAAMSAGDLLLANAPGDVYLGTETLTLPDNTEIIGPGWTWPWYSDAEAFTHGACVRIGSGCRLSNSWIDGNLHNGDFQYPLALHSGVGGLGSLPYPELFRVKVTGESDGLVADRKSVV